MDNSFTIEFGSRRVTFYPLNLKAIRELEPELRKLAGVGRSAALAGGESLATAIKVLTASAQRGNAAITSQDVEEVIDLGNISEVMEALMGNSGLRRADGASNDPTSPRTGGESTQASSPAPAGDGQTSTT